MFLTILVAYLIVGLIGAIISLEGARRGFFLVSLFLWFPLLLVFLGFRLYMLIRYRI